MKINQLVLPVSIMLITCMNAGAYAASDSNDMKMGVKEKKIAASIRKDNDKTINSLILKDFPMVMSGQGGNPNAYIGSYILSGVRVSRLASRCYLYNRIEKVSTIERKNDTGYIYSFSCADADTQIPAYSINGGISPLTDLHYIASKGVEMYAKEFGVTFPELTAILSNDDSGAESTSKNPVIVISSGDNSTYPHTTTTYIGHELGHASAIVMHQGDEYFTGRSGPGSYIEMEEGYAELSGQVLNYYINNKIDFISGEGVLKNGVQGGRPVCESSSSGYGDGDGDKVLRNVFCSLVKDQGWSPVQAFKLIVKAMQSWGRYSYESEAICQIGTAAQGLGLDKKAVMSAITKAGGKCSEGVSISGMISLNDFQPERRHLTVWPVDSGFPKTGYAGARFKFMNTSTVPVTWTITSQDKAATVDADGLVTLIHKPAYPVTITASHGDQTFTFSIPVAINWFTHDLRQLSASQGEAANKCGSMSGTLASREQLTPVTALESQYVEKRALGSVLGEWNTEDAQNYVLNFVTSDLKKGEPVYVNAASFLPGSWDELDENDLIDKNVPKYQGNFMCKL